MADTTFIDGHYLARSWRMLVQDDGWWKPILVLALVAWIPVLGGIAVTGYVLGWARLTAWGIDSAPKQRGVSVGGCIATGWNAFVVELGWGAVGGLVGSVIIGLVPPLTPFVWVAMLFYGLVIFVAVLRSTIYQRIGPGYGLSQIFEMSGRDYGGLVRIIGIELLEYAITFGIGLVVVLVFATALAGPMVQLATLYYGYGSSGLALTPAVIDLIAGAVAWFGPVIVVVGYIFSIISTTFTLLVYNAVALWIRQFNVPGWGGPNDPVPASIPPAPYFFGEPDRGEPTMPPTNSSDYPHQDANAPAPRSPERGEEFVGAPEDVGEPVTPPTPEDLYDVATKDTTEWTETVSPTPDATFHMAWPENGETERPAKADQHGVRPPTAPELYTEVSEEVSRTWPDVDLQTSDAVPAMDDAEMAKAVNEAVAAEATAEGRRAPAPEMPAPTYPTGGEKPEVRQSPVTPPSPEDLYESATKATTRWVEVVTPPASGDGTIPEPEDGATVNPPVKHDDGGVTPPTAPELYTEVANEVAKTWPDVDLQSKDAVASIDSPEMREAVDEAVEAKERRDAESDGTGEDVTHLI